MFTVAIIVLGGLALVLLLWFFLCLLVAVTGAPRCICCGSTEGVMLHPCLKKSLCYKCWIKVGGLVP